jgi:hypothetical protein
MFSLRHARLSADIGRVRKRVSLSRMVGCKLFLSSLDPAISMTLGAGSNSAYSGSN